MGGDGAEEGGLGEGLVGHAEGVADLDVVAVAGLVHQVGVHLFFGEVVDEGVEVGVAGIDGEGLGEAVLVGGDLGEAGVDGDGRERGAEGGGGLDGRGVAEEEIDASGGSGGEGDAGASGADGVEFAGREAGEIMAGDETRGGEGEGGGEKIFAARGGVGEELGLLHAEEAAAEGVGFLAVVAPSENAAEVGVDIDAAAAAEIEFGGGENGEFARTVAEVFQRDGPDLDRLAARDEDALGDGEIVGAGGDFGALGAVTDAEILDGRGQGAAARGEGVVGFVVADVEAVGLEVAEEDGGAVGGAELDEAVAVLGDEGVKFAVVGRGGVVGVVNVHPAAGRSGVGLEAGAVFNEAAELGDGFHGGRGGLGQWEADASPNWVNTISPVGERRAPARHYREGIVTLTQACREMGVRCGPGAAIETV